ncbi:MAG: hypothetical protein NTY61_01355 [Candidatus Parcubacteria bacterium]|nr:hypothetical protein [Candidatus Parcubacteria bacterium]
MELKLNQNPIDTSRIAIKINLQQLWKVLQERFFILTAFRRARADDFGPGARMTKIEVKIDSGKTISVFSETVTFTAQETYQMGGQNFAFSLDRVTGEWMDSTLIVHTIEFFIVPA